MARKLMAKKKRKRPKKTGVPRELERSGSLGLAFANTAAPTPDARRRGSRVVPAALTYAGLVTWLQRMGALAAADGQRLQRATAARPRDAATIVARAGELRLALLRIFTALALGKEAPAADLAVLNHALRVRHVGPQADGFAWLWDGEADELARVLWPPAQSAAELLTSGGCRRVRQCGCQGCYRLFVYQNPRRVWCDANTCGNRAKGRRYADTGRRVLRQLDYEKARDSERRIAAYRKECEERGEVAPFDREDPELGVLSDAWDEELKKAARSGSA
ncbi:MAG: hypothetical protein GY719_34675 [bacterium]|nr:hypothetical protein [bacterium]